MERHFELQNSRLLVFLHILYEAELYEPWSEKHILHEPELHEFMAFSHQHAILHQAWLYALIRIHKLLFLFKPECVPKF